MTTLEKIKKLNYYDGLFKLKNILVDFLSSITSLETNSVIVAEVRVDDSNTLQSGTLVVGRKYYIDTTDLAVGDDFSNVGFVAEGQVFTAIGTTPTNWTNSTPVREIIEDYNIIFNDIDTTNLNITLDYNPSNQSYLLFEISNSGFIDSKSAAFTGISSNYNFSTTDTLSINITESINKDLRGFVKIEVYN